MCGVVDDGGKQQADGDGELVGTDNGASNPLGGRFRLVERNWNVLAVIFQELGIEHRETTYLELKPSRLQSQRKIDRRGTGGGLWQRSGRPHRD